MKLRWKLKKHDVSAEDVMSVFSVEKPVCELLPLDDEQKEAPQVGRLDMSALLMCASLVSWQLF
jgi:predicted RNA-binding protein